MERKLLNRHVKRYQVSRRIGRAQLYVIRVLMVTNNKSQMQQKKLSSSCSPSDASQDCKVQGTNHKLQLCKSQITNYKMEGVNKKLTTNGNEGIKLNEAIEEAKDAEDAEEADEADVNK